MRLLERVLPEFWDSAAPGSCHTKVESLGCRASGFRMQLYCTMFAEFVLGNGVLMKFRHSP